MYKNLLSIFTFITINIFAQVPTEQVSNFSVTDTFAWKVNCTIKVPTSSDSAILFISKSPLTSLTLVDKFYGVGSNISGDIKAIRKFYKGTNIINFTISSLVANTTYYLAFYTFNNKSGVVNYHPTGFKASFKTKGRTIGTYYDGLDTNKAVFLTKLGELLRNHIFSSYDDFDYNIVNELYEQDTFINNVSKKFVTCEYSNIKAYYTGNFTYLGTNFNREHTLPKNWMNFRGVPNGNLVDYPEGADYHNLTLTDGTTNQLRSDFVFKTPTKSVQSIGTAKYSSSTNQNDTNNCFEPQASYRGNAARCVFYMQLCYNNQAGNKWGFKNGLKSFAINQNQELLKTWARTDLVDNFEIARNECIAAVQKSRNPFIDFPDWIDCINFNDFTQLKSCQGLLNPKPVLSINSSKSNEWDVWYFKYSEEKYILKLYHDRVENIDLKLYDLKGSVVYSEKFNVNEGENSFWLDINELPKGTYILHLNSQKREQYLKLLHN